MRRLPLLTAPSNSLTQVYWIYTYCNSLTIFDREREDNLYVRPSALSLGDRRN